MSSVDRPQYYLNTLAPIEVNRASLLKALKELRLAARRGAELLEKGTAPEQEEGGGLFFGFSGIALAFLRLNHQVQSLAEENETAGFDYQKLANERILRHGPDLPLLPGRLSPLGSSSPLAAVVMRILAAATSDSPVSGADIDRLHDAVKIALTNGHIVPHGGRNMGGDELLFGRAGLLWSILNIRMHDFDERTRDALKPIFMAVPKLVDVIIDGGRRGMEDYSQKHGEEGALPLMWTWMEGHHGLGFVHGITGILAALLACKPEELNDGTSRNYFPWIAGTILGLCKICIANKGHLPTVIPPRHSSYHRSSPLVQICHGCPSLLLLMGCARRNSYLASNFWQPEWDETILLATERTWEQGLLSKGGSLCHGISGNAWPLLLLHDSCEYDVGLIQIAKQNYVARTQATDVKAMKVELTGDYFLSKALALLQHARETPPYNPSSDIYRMPDRPFSLAEGLAGTTCAWADACVSIQARLRKMELAEEGETSTETPKNDTIFRELENRQLGFPALAYYRPTGLL